MSTLEDARRIAYKVRCWAENYAQEHGFRSSLSELCAVANGELCKALTQNGFQVDIVEWEGDEFESHCFLILKLQEEYVIDITATQYTHRLDTVVLRRVGDINLDHTPWWGISRRFKDVASFREHQQVGKWPKEQWVLA